MQKNQIIMKRKKILLVFALLAGFASFSQETISPMLNKPMPTFRVKDINGKKYNSSTFKGKVTFINFWFIDCPPCIQELEQLSRLYDTLSKNNKVIFLSMTFDNTDDIRSFIGDDTIGTGGKKRMHMKRYWPFNNQISYPIISSTHKKTEKKFKVTAWPATYIIDKKGYIRMVNIGLKLDEPQNYLYQLYLTKVTELLAEKN